MTSAEDRELGLAVTVDEEGCVDLSPLDPVHRRYLAHREPDGVIVMRPAAVITMAEYDLFRDLVAAFNAATESDAVVTPQ